MDEISRRPLQPKSKEVTEKPDPSLKDVYPQVIASCLLFTMFMQNGLNTSYSATTLPQMLQEGSTLQVTDSEASWFASLVTVSTLVGSLACGLPMDAFGRKATALFTCVPLTLGWMLMAFASHSVWLVYIARILTGLGGGLTTVCLVYIGEISHQQYRPMLLSFNSGFVSLGIVVANVLGVYLDWRTVALCSGLLCIATFLGIWWYCPESPHWTINYRSDNYEDAKNSLKRLYTNNQLSQIEWECLVDRHRTRKQDTSQQPSTSRLSEYTKAVNIIPLLILMTIFLFQQLCGSYPIFFYAVNLFQSIGTTMDKYKALVILGAARLGISLITAIASKKIGRRPLMLASGVGMTVSSAAAAIYFSRRPYAGLFAPASATVLDTDTLSWIGPVSILLYVSMSSFGFLIIPWSLIGELLPMTIRANGSGLVICFTHIVMFCAVKSFPSLLDLFKISGMFYFFCFISISGTIFVYYFLPETLGKSFEEIEKHFASLWKKKGGKKEMMEL